MHYHKATLLAIERQLADAGVPFAVLSSADRQGAVGRVAESNPVVAVHRFFSLSEYAIGPFIVRYQHGLRKLIKELQPRVIVSMSHSGTPTEWWLHHYARSTGGRTVAWQCGYEYNPGRLKRTVLKRFIPRFDFHLCYHTNAQKYAVAHGAQPEQTLVMHNTIDESGLVAGDKATARRFLNTRYPNLEGKRLLLYVGAVLEEKNLDRVLEALAQLRDDRNFFLLVGDGPYLATLRERYAQRTDWLAVGRVVEGVGAYFDAADVLVLPGTGGLAINEAMAHRLAVISGYADGSADDLIEDGVSGIRLRSESVEELARALERVLNDRTLSLAMGVAGEKRIRGELSFQRFIDRVVQTLLAQLKLAGT